MSLGEEMVWLFRTKGLRKPAVLVGAACTSVFLGVMVFDRILSSSISHHLPSRLHSPPPPSSTFHPHHPKHCTLCSNTSTYPSYARLKKYEATRLFKNSVIKRLDVVFLGSNSPIEDRFVVGTSENLGGAFLSMIDGHKGTHCSQYLQENMLQHVSAHIHRALGRQDDLQIVLDMDLVEREALARHSEQSPKATLVSSKDAAIKDAGSEDLTEEIQNGLHESLTTLDDKMSQAALSEVQKVLTGHSLTPDMKNTLMTAVDGACSVTTMVQQNNIVVANTGDCRVVLGRRVGGNTFAAVPLSEDQNAENLKEVERVRTLHPGEENTAISAGRILGGLMPFRTFGDVDYKWEKKNLHGIIPVVANYLTPPYVTAEPVMTRHQITKEDKFVILATDGFWERVSNQDAVETVAGLMPRRKRSLKALVGVKSDSSDDSSAPCCRGNVATELLWQALGGKEEIVSQMLHLEAPISRMYRDDITIMVVYLN